MTLHHINQQIFGLTEAIILLTVLVGYVLHETVTNPTTPLLVILWGVLIVMIAYILKQSVARVAAFIDDVRHD